MKKLAISAILVLLCLIATHVLAQDSTVYKLRLQVPVIDMPQNKDIVRSYPSMNQALELSNSFYDLGFYGLSKVGNAIVKPVKWQSRFSRRNVSNQALNYALGLGFAKYGSELPIPLGIWAHEEFHRSVLGVNGVSSKNGNWIGSRWDGTVYGVTDEALASLKTNNVSGLLHSYVAGAHAQNLTTLTNVQQDFFYRRSAYKNALYLYSAHYVYNYLKFSTSEVSDRVKDGAPNFEDPTAEQRDYAGSDFTAWAYDMFNPDKPYTDRDKFPGGEGVNRRVGFSDLSPEAQDFLLEQKKLSLINFINPAIFFINRINLGSHFSFNFMGQYYPTHFGNDVALVVPIQLYYGKYVVGFHRYSNRNMTLPGVELGLIDGALTNRWLVSVHLKGWMQPKDQSYFATESTAGGSLDLTTKYRISRSVLLNGAVTAKTAGWAAGNPYLDQNFSFRAGLSVNVF
ncbi:hypothetical protein [Telluribacter sp. SYSU D00476]|uniref:hypothetical protein n=1 Tax=Telluribacter sp. SYSU D00476 TaxID=2811430 RepID=UPI001FF2D4F0|nr:hypothetical protein [Telluribacter sp. SYSU D00476]